MAASYSGLLYADGGASSCISQTAGARFDWYEPDSFWKSKGILADGGMVRLQSRLIWQGSGPISDDEHAGVAFTQDQTGEVFNSPSEPGDCQHGWNYGAGAFVRHDGLSIELWQVPTADTIVWNLSAPCGAFVQKPGSPCLCLPFISLVDVTRGNPPPSYITAFAPGNGWALLRQHAYWVRITLTGKPNGWVEIMAELFDSSTLAQMARLNFHLDQIFPGAEVLTGTVFRTAPAAPFEDIWYDLFDYF